MGGLRCMVRAHFERRSSRVASSPTYARSHSCPSRRERHRARMALVRAPPRAGVRRRPPAWHVDCNLDVHAEQDHPTIGILICKSKKDTVVEYALRNINKPIGVSEYTITQNLPDELKSSLPSIEEIEAELGGSDE